jgi:hypothetical protein
VLFEVSINSQNQKKPYDAPAAGVSKWRSRRITAGVVAMEGYGLSVKSRRKTVAAVVAALESHERSCIAWRW